MSADALPSTPALGEDKSTPASEAHEARNAVRGQIPASVRYRNVFFKLLPQF